MSDNSISSHKDPAVTITDTAISEIKRLLQQESNPNLFLRIGVAAGGCSGMSYVMAFDNNPGEHDRQFDYNGLKVVIDGRALPYLTGSVVDYKGGMLGGGFHFSNPNARRSCGCGSSFTC
ncbi:MAG: iron-sulfur cluster assembly accessory protein [Candidatus Zixiibacteriota bacterium]|nr:MAG: iron-sulfur cluster assembly accessory protein [candidate division Zixibacteria bacterium]